MIQVKRLDIKRWKEFESWYTARGDHLPDLDLVPHETGFVAEENGEPVAVGFLILTNTNTGWVEFLQTDPLKSELKQGKALKTLVLAIQDVAKGLGLGVILGLTPEDHWPLARLYERNGAQRASKLMRVFFKRIN